MTPFVSTVVAYGVITVLLWGYGIYLVAACIKAGNRQNTQRKGA